MPMNPQELEQALVARGVTENVCPVCDGDDWIINDTEGAIQLTDPQTREVNFGKAMPVTIMACKNCGFIRLHATDLLS